MQEVEDAYLLLLQATAGWSVDEAGVLSLSDADGNVTLTFLEAPATVTGSDIAALTAALETLQGQIDTAEAEIATLTEAAASVNVNKIRNRIKANEDAIKQINNTIGNLKARIKANEDAIKDHEKRISAIEEALSETTQLPA